MNKPLLLILILLATFGAGCDMELTSQIEDEMLYIEKDIEALEKVKAQLPLIPEEIETLREQVAKRQGELDEFKIKHPDVVEFSIQPLKAGN